MPIVKNLVISGGGVSGIGILGILKYCNEQNILNEITSYTGTSIGSIICLLLSINYSDNEMYEFIENFDLEKLVNNIDINNFLESYGFESSDKIIYVIKRLIENKNLSQEITFAELYEKYQKTLTITGVCLSENKLYYFNHNLTPDMQVLLAVRISCNIPIVFSPIKFQDKLWVDGGIIQNYPIEFFRDDIDNTLGISIYDKCLINSSINNVADFMMNLIKCVAYGNNNLNIANYENNTIKLIFNFETFADFSANHDNIRNMFDSGYECAKNQHNIIEKFINKEEEEKTDDSIDCFLQDIDDSESCSSNSVFTTINYDETASNGSDIIIGPNIKPIIDNDCNSSEGVDISSTIIKCKTGKKLEELSETSSN